MRRILWLAEKDWISFLDYLINGFMIQILFNIQYILYRSGKYKTDPKYWTLNIVGGAEKNFFKFVVSRSQESIIHHANRMSKGSLHWNLLQRESLYFRKLTSH